MSLVAFDALSSLSMKSIWGGEMKRQCSLVDVHKHLGRTYCLHIQGRRANQSRNQLATGNKQTRTDYVPFFLASCIFFRCHVLRSRCDYLILCFSHSILLCDGGVTRLQVIHKGFMLQVLPFNPIYT